MQEVAARMNPVVRGWINYYSCFYRTAVHKILATLQGKLVRWVMRKYKRFKRRRGQAYRWLKQVQKKLPNLFMHWSWLRDIGETTRAV